MKRHWTKEELKTFWTLSKSEIELLRNKKDFNKFGFAISLKYYQYTFSPLSSKDEIPKAITKHIAVQLQLDNRIFRFYDLQGRTAKRNREEMKDYISVTYNVSEAVQTLKEWLIKEIFPKGNHDIDYLKAIPYDFLRRNKAKLPKIESLNKLIKSSLHDFEKTFLESIYQNLNDGTKNSLLKIIIPSDKNDSYLILKDLKGDIGSVNIKNILFEIEKYSKLKSINLPINQLEKYSPRVLEKYKTRTEAEHPAEILAHPEIIKFAYLAIYVYARRVELLDNILDATIQIIHKFTKSAEKDIDNKILKEIKKGNKNILFNIAKASLDNRKSPVEEVVFPAAGGEEILLNIAKRNDPEINSYARQTKRSMCSSYSHHYRRITKAIFEVINLKTDSLGSLPLIEAVNIIKQYGSASPYFPLKANIPIKGVISHEWENFVYESESNGRIKKINYELAVLCTIREKLRYREIWVEDSCKYRNTGKDLPSDFNHNPSKYFDLLGFSENVDDFIRTLKEDLNKNLRLLNNNIPRNKKVEILTKNNGWIYLRPFKKQDEPINIEKLKKDVFKQWPSINLIDVLKETELRTGFCKAFKNTGTRNNLSKKEQQKRIILSLYAYEMNTGLKRVSLGSNDIDYNELRHIKTHFLNKTNIRNAICRIVNSILEVRNESLWETSTSTCAASDSKKFGVWDQNLIAEWHARYRGRGVMIYWHVEKKAICIYSQLKTCSSSEVASMIEGVLRHCSDLDIKGNYVDSHGQSEVGFAFSYMLNFDLLPRLKDIHTQHFYISESSDYNDLTYLQPILRRPINWDIIKESYNDIVKYASALKIGTADTESILNIFTRKNAKHSVYKAISELGKVIKTIFLCKYLRSEKLRIEINEGLNVIENWNSVNDFIFYGKSGEISTNRRSEQELSMLFLHLLQIAIAYINTLLIQKVLSENKWLSKLTLPDRRALTPLIYEHINPYGLFPLDMEKRLLIEDTVA